MDDLVPRRKVCSNIAGTASIDNRQERELFRVMFIALERDALSLIIEELFLETLTNRRMEIAILGRDARDVRIVIEVLYLHRESIREDSAQAIEVFEMEVCGELGNARENIREDSRQTIAADGKPKVLCELNNTRG